MNQETEKNPKISYNDMERVMSGAEGKELMSLLSEGGGLQEAMEAFKKGDMKGVQKALSSAMENPRTMDLMRKINGK